MQLGALGSSFHNYAARPAAKAVPDENAQREQSTSGQPSLNKTEQDKAEASKFSAHSAHNDLQSEQVLAEIRQLAKRDQEVRTHEQAHAAVGGALAGSPSYTYTRGPDGRNYVSDGEVSIDSAPVEGDPQATIEKMQQVYRAAVAPAQPSAQDRQVAAQAQAQISESQGELSAQRREAKTSDAGADKSSEPAGLEQYRQVAQADDEQVAQVDIQA